MRVAIVVGDLLTRHGLVTILQQDTATAVVGVAGDLRGGRELLRSKPLDVLIVGARLPPMLEAAAPLLLQEARALGIRTIVVADDIDPTVVSSLLGDDAGGWGWLVRDQLSDPAWLLSTVDRVNRGGTVIDDAIVHQLAGQSRRSRSDP